MGDGEPVRCLRYRGVSSTTAGDPHLEQLIEEVRKYPCLYNINSLQYRDQLRKEECWSIISTILYTSPCELKKEWKRLRDGYRQALVTRLNSKTEKKKKALKPWKYEEHMDFLKPYICPRSRLLVNTRSLSSDNEIEYFTPNPVKQEVLSDEDTSQASASEQPSIVAQRLRYRSISMSIKPDPDAVPSPQVGENKRKKKTRDCPSPHKRLAYSPTGNPGNNRREDSSPRPPSSHSDITPFTNSQSENEYLPTIINSWNNDITLTIANPGEKNPNPATCSSNNNDATPSNDINADSGYTRETSSPGNNATTLSAVNNSGNKDFTLLGINSGNKDLASGNISDNNGIMESNSNTINNINPSNSGMTASNSNTINSNNINPGNNDATPSTSPNSSSSSTRNAGNNSSSSFTRNAGNNGSSSFTRNAGNNGSSSSTRNAGNNSRSSFTRSAGNNSSSSSTRNAGNNGSSSSTRNAGKKGTTTSSIFADIRSFTNNVGNSGMKLPTKSLTKDGAYVIFLHHDPTDPENNGQENTAAASSINVHTYNIQEYRAPPPSTNRRNNNGIPGNRDTSSNVTPPVNVMLSGQMYKVIQPSNGTLGNNGQQLSAIQLFMASIYESMKQMPLKYQNNVKINTLEFLKVAEEELEHWKVQCANDTNQSTSNQETSGIPLNLTTSTSSQDNNGQDNRSIPPSTNSAQTPQSAISFFGDIDQQNVALQLFLASIYESIRNMPGYLLSYMKINLMELVNTAEEICKGE